MARKSAFEIARRAGEAFVPERDAGGATPLWLVWGDDLASIQKAIGKAGQAWLEATAFKPAAGAFALLPGTKGELTAVVGCLDAASPETPFGPFALGQLASDLPPGDYRLANPPADPHLAALLVTGWALGGYEFTAYRPQRAKRASPRARLALPDGLRRRAIEDVVVAVTFARDLVNTPANDLGPDELEEAARALAKVHGAELRSVVGDALLTENFPMIHAVGRASVRAPRLVELRWAPPRLAKSAPRLALVGKGICFDTGGLDIKPALGMLLMKKDMGGAASVLALAHMVMSAKLAVDLRVLLAVAENSISGNAFRPGDVLTARNGSTVEIQNTDAEGRLVLADALALADEEKPDDIVSFATLTGAARVALGPDLPPLYSTDPAFAEALAGAGREVLDPLWPMPLWRPYAKMLATPIADVNHASDSPFGGSITAALFLERFVKAAKRYTHLDIYGWVPARRPASPKGGEAQGARALFHLLEQRHGSAS
ncbi:MAG: leucyl aminopeptidase family protein [Rhizobiales bacterium]|nr:leucyl aminopeptidase family protein [Hyphomicrobiales bacterium]